MNLSKFPTEARKALAAVSGAVAEAVALGLLHGQAEQWTTGILAVITAAAVYLLPNDKAAGVVDPPPPPLVKP